MKDKKLNLQIQLIAAEATLQGNIKTLERISPMLDLSHEPYNLIFHVIKHTIKMIDRVADLKDEISEFEPLYKKYICPNCFESQIIDVRDSTNNEFCCLSCHTLMNESNKA